MEKEEKVAFTLSMVGYAEEAAQRSAGNRVLRVKSRDLILAHLVGLMRFLYGPQQQDRSIVHMSDCNESAMSLDKPTLTLSGVRAFLFQVSFIGAAVALPSLAHLTGAPVRYLLPMHWPVILAGLAYGWRGGALTGLLAPVTSYLLSGLPSPVILPSMTLELLIYGLVTGFLREQTRLSSFLSVTVALVAGRIVFVASLLLGNVVTADHSAYFRAALLPGLVAALCQIAFLPLLGKWWVRQERGSRKAGRREDQE